MTWRKVSFLLGMILVNSYPEAQPLSDTNWYWRSGDYDVNARSIYWPITNFPWVPTPGARSRCASWTGADGTLWMFGGEGYDSLGQLGSLNDLWKYTSEWRWLKGSTLKNSNGHYGTMAQPDPQNTPGGRFGCMTWTDNDGNLWLFGGKKTGGPYGNDLFYMNDLWMYAPSTNSWKWVAGDSTVNAIPVRGTMGVAAAANTPGARASASTWKDLQGNLWLFGGYGAGLYNDLWKYNINDNTWTWMKGSTFGFVPGIYGVQGVADAANCPGSRWMSASWTDAGGKFWLWGGNGVSELPGGNLNDLWRYDPATNNWTWMKGGKLHDQPNVYGTRGIANAANTPCGREEVYAWQDDNGNFWIYGGAGYAPGYLSSYGTFSDLWQYRPSSNEWTWIKGDTIPGRIGRYNVGAVPQYWEHPGARARGSAWTRSNGALLIFGGEGYATNGPGKLNCMWAIRSSSLILPVHLTNFSGMANGKNIMLSWATAEEINFRQFNLQRSMDGSDFKTVAMIEGRGQHAPANYTYTDWNARSLYSGRLLYRLEMMNNDGSSEFSSVVLIPSDKTNGQLQVFPNPVADRLYANILLARSEKAFLEIISAQGSVMIQSQMELQPGNNAIETDVRSLSAGVYLVVIKTSGDITSIRFIKN